MTELSGAVVAPGTVVVDSHVKKVQHPTGGVVGEILARDGDRVRAGDIVIRLDETIAKANLAMVAKSLDELSARKARLEAERDGLKGCRFPPLLSPRPSRKSRSPGAGRASACSKVAGRRGSGRSRS